jgi:diadenosine tetraphosphate (Ap4A) HIT family hydrolase
VSFRAALRAACVPENMDKEAAMTCPLCDNLRIIERGDHESTIEELSETFAVLSEKQGCRGWSVLILKDHHEHLADLPPAQQARVFEDVSRMAAAVRRVFGPVRINYECLGNQVSHVHWHIIPRHRDDPDPRNAIWGWPAERLAGCMNAVERRELAAKLRAALHELTVISSTGD